MAGNLNLGDDLNSQLFRVSHDAANLFLRVEAAVVFGLRNVSKKGWPSLCADVCQQRVFFNFYAPALVVRQVPVHAVHAAQGRGVKHPSDILRRHIVPAYVQHKTLVGKALYIHIRFSLPLYYLWPGIE